MVCLLRADIAMQLIAEGLTFSDMQQYGNAYATVLKRRLAKEIISTYTGHWMKYTTKWLRALKISYSLAGISTHYAVVLPSTLKESPEI
jgi:hypothetical protein